MECFCYMQKEIESLEKKIQENEEDLRNEKILQEQLHNEGYKGWC